MIFYPFLNYMLATPLFIPTDDRPPLIYDILDSILNYGKSTNERIKATQLSEKGHKYIFDFDYPLAENIKRDDFEIMILNKFLMRRIGFETFNLFKIQLNVKLNEIMPKYNKMFLALNKWNIFEDGEKIKRSGENVTKSKTDNELNNNSNTNTENIDDLRSSNTPQNRLENVRSGAYVTEYNYNTNNIKSNDTSKTTGKSNNDINNRYNEETIHTPSNKIEIFEKMQNEIKNIYTLIFNDLEELFYLFI